MRRIPTWPSGKTGRTRRSGASRIGLVAIFSAVALVAAACTGSSSGTEAELPPLPELPETTSGSDPAQSDPADPAAGSATGGPVRCAHDGPSSGVVAFFALCTGDGSSAPVPVFRPDAGYEPAIASRLERRVEALVSGTSPSEQTAGLTVGFDEVDERDRIDVAAAIDGAGVVTIELRLDGGRWDPGPRAGTSAQLLSFLDPLYATVFHEPEVTGIDLDDLCWGELGCGAGVITRTTWQGTLFTNHGILSHGGCDPTEAWSRPADCTAAGLLAGELGNARVVDVADDDTLNLRSGPDVDHSIVGEVPPGAEVEVTTAAAPAPDGGHWRLIRAGGTTGWANAAFVSPSRTPAEAIIDELVAFADQPNAGTFDRLPLASRVGLGLGPELVLTVPAEQLRNPADWAIDKEYYRGYVGPFSALDVLARLGLYEVTTGPHPHCVADPVPAPAGLAELERISVQPHDDVITSCLEWSTVDLFLDESGRVAAITLDLWEP